MTIQSLRKSQQGFAHIVLVAVLLLAAAGVGGLAYWRISSYNNSHGDNANGAPENDGSGTNTATVSEECIAMTHDENICHLGAIDGFEKHAATVKIVMQGEDGSRTFTEKFDAKGGTVVESEGINGITVGGHTYVQLDGTWIDYGGDNSNAASAPEAPALATTAGVKYENLGKVDCGDTTCFKYRCTGGILGSSTVLVTFGTKDYLPRHYDISTPSGGESLLGNMTMDITYGSVSIIAPAGALTMEQYQQRLLGN